MIVIILNHCKINIFFEKMLEFIKLIIICVSPSGSWIYKLRDMTVIWYSS